MCSRRSARLYAPGSSPTPCYTDLAERWDDVTTLPKSLRVRLEEEAPLRTLTVEEEQRGSDGTVKLRLRTADGYPLEAVAMRHRDRRTVCLSSQSGCALACTFCATGSMGLGRNLTPGEILEQLFRLARTLREEHGARVGNVVMMGMGEPFHNYDNVLGAIRAMNDPEATDWARATSRSRRPAGCPASIGWPKSRCRSSSRSRCTRQRRAAHASSCRSRSATRSRS